MLSKVWSAIKAIKAYIIWWIVVHNLHIVKCKDCIKWMPHRVYADMGLCRVAYEDDEDDRRLYGEGFGCNGFKPHKMEAK